MTIKIIDKPIALSELKAAAQATFGDMVKIVVDLEKRVMAIGAELHADEEDVLLRHGSKQENLWGANIYPELSGDHMFEYDSMINIRPRAGNKAREIQDQAIRDQVKAVALSLIVDL